MKNTFSLFSAVGLLAVLALVNFSPMAQAVTISTSACSATNVPPNGSASCAGLGSAVGFTNLQLKLDYALDLTYDPFNPPGSATFALDSPLLPWDLTGLVVTNLNRPLNGAVGPTAISAVDYAANFAAPFSVNVSAVFGGTATNGNANMQWTLSGDRIPDQEGVPEPATMLLAGSALIAGGLARRKRLA